VTKRRAEELWRKKVLPHVSAEFEKNGRVDVPARAESWNNFTDALCKSKLITTRQYDTWGHPR